MTTRRYALDGRNHKVYIGSTVNYNNRRFLVEDIQYLSWNTEQYLTLIDQKNKKKDRAKNPMGLGLGLLPFFLHPANGGGHQGGAGDRHRHHPAEPEHVELEHHQPRHTLGDEQVEVIEEKIHR